jgi:hypothetical protein
MASEIYGLIIASSVLAASADDDDIVHVSLSVLVTLVVYWLAESYAHVMALMHARAAGTMALAVRELRSGWPLVSASFIPLLAVVTSAVLGQQVRTAQTVGMICSTVLLFGSGWIAGRSSGLTGIRRLLAALIAAGFGLALIGLKAALH